MKRLVLALFCLLMLPPAVWAQPNVGLPPLLHTSGNAYLNRDLTAADAVLYFGVPTGEATHFLKWDNGDSRFELSHDLLIGTGEGGVDYTVGVDGQNNDGLITFDEDNDIWNFSDKITVSGGSLVIGSGADADTVLTFADDGNPCTVTWDEDNGYLTIADGDSFYFAGTGNDSGWLTANWEVYQAADGDLQLDPSASQTVDTVNVNASANLTVGAVADFNGEVQGTPLVLGFGWDAARTSTAATWMAGPDGSSGNITSDYGFCAPAAGHIIGMSITASVADAGCGIQYRSGKDDGAVTTYSLSFTNTGTGVYSQYTSAAKGTYTFAAGDNLGIVIEPLGPTVSYQDVQGYLLIVLDDY